MPLLIFRRPIINGTRMRPDLVVWLFAATLLSSGCTKTGGLEVFTRATGPAVEGASVAVEVDGAVSGDPIALNGGHFAIPDAPVGIHVLKITGVPGNCAVAGGAERRIQVTAGYTKTIEFFIRCS
jgi:hypothetical protein